MEKLLNINEAAEHLGLSPEEVRKLVDKGKIPAYQIGGVFLRFRKNQIDAVKRSALRLQSARRVRDIISSRQPSLPSNKDYSFREKLKDFLYFNDFYIISLSIILIILIIIF